MRATDIKTFAECVSNKTKSVNERAVAFIFYRTQMSDIPEASIKDLISDFDTVSFPAPNPKRLRESLNRDKRTMKVLGEEKWKIRSDRMAEVIEIYGQCINLPQKTVDSTDSIVPREITENTRNYIEEVTRQINICYDVGCFDASGVMIRRIVETLIIELFEFKKNESKIKDKTGNYFMLEGLINATLAESSINLGRNAKKGLGDAKWLGDQSAHSRRFIATQTDIDKVQPNVRILIEELIILIFR